MGRLLALLALGGLVWWGWDFWAAKTAQAHDDGAFVDDVVGDEQPLRKEAGSAKPEEAPSAPAADDDRVAAFIQKLRDGDARAVQNAFVAYGKMRTEADRRRVGGAIAELAAEASVERAAELLGTSNAFLHTDLGRALARKVAERARTESPQVGLQVSTTILEAATNGPIAVGDADAKGALNALYDKHRLLVRRVVFDPANAARARRYKVQPGDSLDRIARRFRDSELKLASGTLALVNRIKNPNALRAGQVLRVPIDPVHCVARRSSYTLLVYLGDDLVRLYWMAHGKEGHETPETTFVVGDKIQNPDWPHPDGRLIPFGDPENPLGRYFVKFQHESYTGFGAHGTNEPESIGTMASLGCLRLLPNDIEEFTNFVPKGSKVLVQ